MNPKTKLPPGVGHGFRTWQDITSRRKRMVQIIGHGVLRRLKGYEMFMPDLTEDDLSIMRTCKQFSATSPERMYGLINGVRYLVANQIAGDFVECGVWKGGSAMVMMKTLLQMGAADREIYLYDTFTGMTAPTEKDKSAFEADTQRAYDALKQ